MADQGLPCFNSDGVSSALGSSSLLDFARVVLIRTREPCRRSWPCLSRSVTSGGPYGIWFLNRPLLVFHPPAPAFLDISLPQLFRLLIPLFRPSRWNRCRIAAQILWHGVFRLQPSLGQITTLAMCFLRIISTLPQNTFFGNFQNIVLVRLASFALSRFLSRLLLVLIHVSLLSGYFSQGAEV